jgi:cystathionine beta-lyase
MYGTFGTPTTQALAELLLEQEGGAGAAFAPSGLAAVALALLSVVRSGDHILVPDAVYGPTREICDVSLPRFGVATQYYDPLVGPGIAALFRDNTRAVFMESPGSYSFEVQDVPAIVRAARTAPHEIVTIMDNAWGSPGLFMPLAHDVDISVVPLTKYWGGHADLLGGSVVANDRLWPDVRSTAFALGLCTNADEAFLALRGARSVDVRVKAHEASGLAVAHWLEEHPRVGRVLHPALPCCPGHDTWRRDFHGSNGLFAFELLGREASPGSLAEGAAFVDALVRGGHFGLGYSWGGFESLVMPAAVPSTSNIARTVRPWDGGALIRLHIGLEPVERLIGEVERALEEAIAV